MFNETGHKPPPTGISQYRKSALPYICNFLFGIFLGCLTGHTTSLDKEKLEVHEMIASLYYDLNVNYVTKLWENSVQEFLTPMSRMVHLVRGIGA